MSDYLIAYYVDKKLICMEYLKNVTEEELKYNIEIYTNEQPKVNNFIITTDEELLRKFEQEAEQSGILDAKIIQVNYISNEKQIHILTLEEYKNIIQSN